MKLLALRCPTCGQKLEPLHNETVVTSCQQCATAVSLQGNILQAVEVTYAAPTGDKVDAWLPFWVFHGRVNLQQRRSQGRSQGQDRAAQALWQRVKDFYVPAWEASANEARFLGGGLLEAQPDIQTISRPSEAVLNEVIFNPDDARHILDFIVISIEAKRKDMLADLQFDIELSQQPQLWAVPAQKKGSRWHLSFQSQ